MSDFREDLLTTILDCGYGDLYILEDCQYDLGDIVGDCLATFGKLDINSLVKIMFDYGLRDIELERDCKIDELGSTANWRDLDEEEQAELDALQELEPFDDMQSFHNFIDTHIWIDAKDKIDAYQKYLKEALDHFEEMTGFAIQY